VRQVKTDDLSRTQVSYPITSRPNQYCASSVYIHELGSSMSVPASKSSFLLRLRCFLLSTLYLPILSRLCMANHRHSLGYWLAALITGFVYINMRHFIIPTLETTTHKPRIEELSKNVLKIFSSTVYLLSI